MRYTEIEKQCQRICDRLDELAHLKNLGIEPPNHELDEIEDFVEAVRPTVDLVEYCQILVLCQQQ
jgi:hypothetical protein